MLYFDASGCFYDGECDDNRIEYVTDPATSVNFNVDNLKVTFSTKFVDIFVCSYHINNSEIQYQDKIKYNFRTKRTIHCIFRTVDFSKKIGKTFLCKITIEIMVEFVKY